MWLFNHFWLMWCTKIGWARLTCIVQVVYQPEMAENSICWSLVQLVFVCEFHIWETKSVLKGDVVYWLFIYMRDIESWTVFSHCNYCGCCNKRTSWLCTTVAWWEAARSHLQDVILQHSSTSYSCSSLWWKWFWHDETLLGYQLG